MCFRCRAWRERNLRPLGRPGLRLALSALGVGAFDVHDFFVDIRVAHQVHERAFSSTGKEKDLRDFVTHVTLVIVPSVLRREKCSLGILVRSEQL